MTYAEVLTALADPTRRNIFEALSKHPMTVRELADGQPVSRPAVSQHLKILETARLVRAVPEGARRVYSLEHEGLEDLRQYVESFWSDVLAAYGVAIAKRTASKRKRARD